MANSRRQAAEKMYLGRKHNIHCTRVFPKFFPAASFSFGLEAVFSNQNLLLTPTLTSHIHHVGTSLVFCLGLIRMGFDSLSTDQEYGVQQGTGHSGFDIKPAYSICTKSHRAAAPTVSPSPAISTTRCVSMSTAMRCRFHPLKNDNSW